MNPGKDPEPDYSKLDEKKKRAARQQDARLFMTAGRAAGQYCTYTDQMVAAGRFSQAAEAYRLLGETAKQRLAEQLAKTASANADKCAAAKKRQAQKPSSKPPAKQAKAQNREKCAAAKKQYETLRDAKGDVKTVLWLRGQLKTLCGM